MKLNDFNAALTAKRLNESALKQFGQHIDFENFTLEELYDARNKLRTVVHQLEQTSQYNEIFENEEYQKTKLFLDVLNAAINERGEFLNLTSKEKEVINRVAEGKIEMSALPKILQEKAKSKAQQKFMGMVYAAKKGEKPASKEVEKASKGMSKKAAKDFAKKVSESILREGEEEKASLIMATRDMVDRITGWMEDCASMQAEQMLDLTDSIRYELGADMAVKFEQTVKPALASIYDSLDQNRKQLTVGVSMLTGEEHAMMGENPAADEGQTVNLGPDDAEMEEPSDEFGASEAAAGGSPTGRETRESREYRILKKK